MSTHLAMKSWSGLKRSCQDFECINEKISPANAIQASNWLYYMARRCPPEFHEPEVTSARSPRSLEEQGWLPDNLATSEIRRERQAKIILGNSMNVRDRSILALVVPAKMYCLQEVPDMSIAPCRGLVTVDYLSLPLIYQTIRRPKFV